LEMDDIKNQLKKIPAWGWAAIAGGVGLVIFLSSRSGGYQVYTPNSVPADPSQNVGGGDGGQVAYDYEKKLLTLEGQLKEGMFSSFNQLGESFTKANQMIQADYTQRLQFQKAEFDQKVGMLTDMMNESRADKPTSVSHAKAGATAPRDANVQAEAERVKGVQARVREYLLKRQAGKAAG
jgi:hypothetical protein